MIARATNVEPMRSRLRNCNVFHPLSGHRPFNHCQNGAASRISSVRVRSKYPSGATYTNINETDRVPGPGVRVQLDGTLLLERLDRLKRMR